MVRPAPLVSGRSGVADIVRYRDAGNAGALVDSTRTTLPGARIGPLQVAIPILIRQFGKGKEGDGKEAELASMPTTGHPAAKK